MTDMPEPGQMEEDWLYMQQLYPNTARKLVYYIEDAADRLEYENSMMFDNYPGPDRGGAGCQRDYCGHSGK